MFNFIIGNTTPDSYDEGAYQITARLSEKTQKLAKEFYQKEKKCLSFDIPTVSGGSIVVKRPYRQAYRNNGTVTVEARFSNQGCWTCDVYIPKKNVRIENVMKDIEKSISEGIKCADDWCKKS